VEIARTDFVTASVPRSPELGLGRSRDVPRSPELGLGQLPLEPLLAEARAAVDLVLAGLGIGARLRSDNQRGGLLRSLCANALTFNGSSLTVKAFSENSFPP